MDTIDSFSSKQFIRLHVASSGAAKALFHVFTYAVELSKTCKLKLVELPFNHLITPFFCWEPLDQTTDLCRK